MVTTHGSGDDPDGLRLRLPHCERVVSIPYMVPKRGDREFPLAVARSWLSPYPVDLWKWRVEQVRQQVDTLIGDGGVDVCVADFLFAAANVPLGGPVPVVLFEHNVEYLIWKRLSAIESSPLRHALFEVEWRKLRAREAAACAGADLTIAVSEQDRQRLCEIVADARVESIPTGVDTAYFTPTAGRELPSRLVFTGSMDWHPNEDAVQHFADAILPLIRREIPGVSLAVVGRRPTERLRALAEQTGILVTGTVDVVRPFID